MVALFGCGIWCSSEIIVSINVKSSFLNNILFEHLSCCIHVLYLLLKIVKLSRIYHVNSIYSKNKEMNNKDVFV